MNVRNGRKSALSALTKIHFPLSNKFFHCLLFFFPLILFSISRRRTLLFHYAKKFSPKSLINLSIFVARRVKSEFIIDQGMHKTSLPIDFPRSTLFFHRFRHSVNSLPSLFFSFIRPERKSTKCDTDNTQLEGRSLWICFLHCTFSVCVESSMERRDTAASLEFGDISRHKTREICRF
jgi:hypothetical protein